MAWWICDDGKFDQFDVSSVDTVCQAMGEEKLPPESQTGEATNIIVPDLRVKADQYHPGQFDQAYQFDQSNHRVKCNFDQFDQFDQGEHQNILAQVQPYQSAFNFSTFPTWNVCKSKVVSYTS